MIEKVMEDGPLVGDLPDLEASRDRPVRQLAALPAHLRRLENAPAYTVAVSARLKELAEQVAAEVERQCNRVPGS